MPTTPDPWIATRVYPVDGEPLTIRGTTPDGAAGTLILAEVLSQTEEGIDITLHGVVQAIGETLSLTVASAALSAASRSGATPPVAPADGYAIPGLYVLFRAGNDPNEDLSAVVEAHVKRPGPGADAPAGLGLKITGAGKLTADEGGWPVGTLPADAIFGEFILHRNTPTTPSIPGPRLHAIVVYEGDHSDTEGYNTTILALRDGTGITTHVFWEADERSEGYTVGYVNVSDLASETGDITCSWLSGGAYQYRTRSVTTVTLGASFDVDVDLTGGTIALAVPWATP